MGPGALSLLTVLLRLFLLIADEESTNKKAIGVVEVKDLPYSTAMTLFLLPALSCSPTLCEGAELQDYFLHSFIAEVTIVQYLTEAGINHLIRAMQSITHIHVI